MRIKAKGIAKELGLSEATVSLALNDRPGVNENTKKRILECVREKQEKLQENFEIQKKIVHGKVMMLNYIKNGIIMKRSQEQNPIIEKIRETVKREGYTFEYRLFQEQFEEIGNLISECREKDVKGIYIMAAEMGKSDIYPFLELQIPIVTGDNLFYEEGINSFLIDNREGIRRGVDYLVDKGHSRIVYLAEDIDIFNFLERREAFVLEMAKRECGDVSNRIRHLGSNVEEVAFSMGKYLDEGMRGVTALILESSVISMGVIKALLERNVRIPKDISLIGFDAVAPVELPGFELTLIKETHTKRHLAAVKHLMQYMKDENEEIMRVYYRTRLFEGQTVFDKSKYMYCIKFWWQVFKENLNTCYFFINWGKEAKKKKDKICKIAEKSKGD